MRASIVVLCVALLMTSAALTVADTEEAAPLVTLTADDTPATEVAAEIEEQTKTRVAVTERGEYTVTGALTDYEVEAAVEALAVAMPGSWLRGYMIEQQPPDEPYSAEELIDALTATREWWMGSMTDAERGELMQVWRDARGDQGRGGFGQGPGGGPAQGGQLGEDPQPAEPRQEGERRARLTDPLRQIALPVQAETITLTLGAVTADEAITAFTTQSGYLILADPELQGLVVLEAEDAPLDEVLDKIAEAMGGTWRPFYIVSQPYELTQEEQDQRFEQRFTQRWADYWAMTAEERAAYIQRRVGRLERMAERMQQPQAEGQGGRRRGGRMRAFLPRILERTTQYSTTLTQEQRMELKPYLQALAKIAAM